MGVIMTLVVGSGTAYAATGGKFILGKSNSAGKTTSLTNKKGTALALGSKAGTPSLKVSSSTRVPNLNADLIDGLDGSRLALTTGQTNTIAESGTAIDTDNPTDGIPDVVVAFATCPAGTKLTGGGGDDYTDDGVIFANSPLDRSTWMVASTADPIASPADNVMAYAQCYNPRGAIQGGNFRTAPAKPSASALAIAKDRLAKKVG
jgi:hypothetical protein